MRTQTTLALGLVLFTGCFDAGSESTSGSSDDNLIGGVNAKGAALDAIGVLTGVRPGGVRANLCTATLIGPHTVLAAKHCVEPTPGVPVLSKAPFYFQIGYDSANPKQSIRVISGAIAPLDTGGLFGIGSDVGVFQLAEDVTDVTPAAIAGDAIVPEEIGSLYSAIGYGLQHAGQTTNDLLTRKAGSMTLQALTGHPLHVMFETADDLLAYLTEVEGADYVAASGQLFVNSYNNPAGALIDGYEAYLGMGPHDAQVCNIDSGSPILRRVNGELTVYGVSSRTWAGRPVPCLLGGVYATLDQPDTRGFIDDSLADECRGVPTTGSCAGTTAVRCTTPEEGPRRIVMTECADLGTTCVVSDGEAGCE